MTEVQPKIRKPRSPMKLSIRITRLETKIQALQKQLDALRAEQANVEA